MEYFDLSLDFFVLLGMAAKSKYFNELMK